jgi:gamma-glutamyltranspeptidase
VLAGHHTMADAVAAPRVHDQGAGTPRLVEPGITPAIRSRLAAHGRQVVEFPDLGAAAAVGRDARGAFVAAGDARKDGGAVVVP